MIANFNENSLSSKYQLSSVIQKTSGRAKERRSETNRSRESRGIESRGSIEKEESKRNNKVFSIMEEIYSRV